MFCSIINDGAEISDSIKGVGYFDYLSYCDL